MIFGDLHILTLFEKKQMSILAYFLLNYTIEMEVYFAYMQFQFKIITIA